MELEALLTTYGPLGLGWVFAAYLLKQNLNLQEKVMAAFLADTEAKGALRQSLEKLTDIVEKR